MMKSVLRSASALVLVLLFTAPLFAQNPNVAIRLVTDNKACVKGTLKNLRPTTIADCGFMTRRPASASALPGR